MRSRITGRGTISITTFHTKKQIHGPVLVRRAAASQGAGLSQFIQRSKFQRVPPPVLPAAVQKGGGPSKLYKLQTRQDKDKTKTIFYGPLLVRHTAVSLGGGNQTKLQDYKLQTDRHSKTSSMHPPPEMHAAVHEKGGRKGKLTKTSLQDHTTNKQILQSSSVRVARSRVVRRGNVSKITSQAKIRQNLLLLTTTYMNKTLTTFTIFLSV